MPASMTHECQRRRQRALDARKRYDQRRVSGESQPMLPALSCAKVNGRFSVF